MTVVKSGDTPGEILRTTVAPDDVGAETADRYRWQAMMATADVLAVYHLVCSGDLTIDGAGVALICEHHEDWAIVMPETAEIVSAKHREASVGPFSTYKQLMDKGGILHLFRRWEALQRTPKCRLVTTSGLSDDAAKTKTACDLLKQDLSRTDELCKQVIEAVGKEIATLSVTETSKPPAPDASVLRAFLAALSFQVAEARRDHLADMVAERYGRPVAKCLGFPNAGAAVWSATFALVEPRMRNAGPSRGGALPVVLGIPHAEEMARRTVSLRDVDTAVQFAVRHSAGYAPLPRRTKANKMAVKMVQGGCSDNSIERADALRLQYKGYLRALRGTPTLSERQAGIMNTLYRIVDEATNAVCGQGTQWGVAFWSELDARFRAIVGSAEAHGLNADLMLGGVSEMANNCKVWYSEAFDAAGVLRRLVDEKLTS